MGAHAPLAQTPVAAGAPSLARSHDQADASCAERRRDRVLQLDEPAELRALETNVEHASADHLAMHLKHGLSGRASSAVSKEEAAQEVERAAASDGVEVIGLVVGQRRFRDARELPLGSLDVA